VPQYSFTDFPINDILKENIFTYELWKENRDIYTKNFGKLFENLGYHDVILWRKKWNFLIEIMTAIEEKDTKRLVWFLLI